MSVHMTHRPPPAGTDKVSRASARLTFLKLSAGDVVSYSAPRENLMCNPFEGALLRLCRAGREHVAADRL